MLHLVAPAQTRLRDWFRSDCGLSSSHTEYLRPFRHAIDNMFDAVVIAVGQLVDPYDEIIVRREIGLFVDPMNPGTVNLRLYLTFDDRCGHVEHHGQRRNREIVFLEPLCDIGAPCRTQWTLVAGMAALMVRTQLLQLMQLVEDEARYTLELVRGLKARDANR